MIDAEKNGTGLRRDFGRNRGSAKFTGGNTEFFLESLTEITGVAKSEFLGYDSQGTVAFFKQSSGGIQPLVEQILMKRKSRTAPENP